jgi:hypothetical protein
MRVCIAVNRPPFSLRPPAADEQLDHHHGSRQENDGEDQKGGGRPEYPAEGPNNSQTGDPKPGVAGMSQESDHFPGAGLGIVHAQPVGGFNVQFKHFFEHETGPYNDDVAEVQPIVSWLRISIEAVYLDPGKIAIEVYKQSASELHQWMVITLLFCQFDSILDTV